MPLDKLLQTESLGNAEDEVLSSIAIAHINVGDVNRFATPVPLLAEQAHILAEVDANLQRYKALRQATLSNAFSYQEK